MAQEVARPTEGYPLAVRVVHASPGRVRVKVPKEAFTDGALGEAERALGALRGVREVRRNPRAASVVVSYDPGLVDQPALLDAVAAAGMAIVTPGDDGANGAGDPHYPVALAQLLGTPFRRADERLAAATRRGVDLRTLVPVGLALLAAREILAGRLGNAPWYTLLWYAFDSYIKLQRPYPAPPPLLEE